MTFPAELITHWNTMPLDVRESGAVAVLRWLGPEGADVIEADPDGEGRIQPKAKVVAPKMGRPVADDVVQLKGRIIAHLTGRDARTCPELAAELKVDLSLLKKALYQGEKNKEIESFELTTPRAMPGSKKPAKTGYRIPGAPETVGGATTAATAPAKTATVPNLAVRFETEAKSQTVFAGQTFTMPLVIDNAIEPVNFELQGDATAAFRVDDQAWLCGSFDAPGAFSVVVKVIDKVGRTATTSMAFIVREPKTVEPVTELVDVVVPTKTEVDILDAAPSTPAIVASKPMVTLSLDDL